ncbi:hypothetical protein ElyMa_002170400 [Elysia marginata]|uniref:Uncharacterized protein n=1 Tax=Elysia marginata TaxID=1093978 RepID=A0AAV4FMW3_9GAST|nr:hypothetical protein ElyMa_002170400 [Elysia marginata]
MSKASTKCLSVSLGIPAVLTADHSQDISSIHDLPRAYKQHVYYASIRIAYRPYSPPHLPPPTANVTLCRVAQRAFQYKRLYPRQLTQRGRLQ